MTKSLKSQIKNSQLAIGFKQKQKTKKEEVSTNSLSRAEQGDTVSKAKQKKLVVPKITLKRNGAHTVVKARSAKSSSSVKSTLQQDKKQGKVIRARSSSHFEKKKSALPEDQPSSFAEKKESQNTPDTSSSSTEKLPAPQESVEVKSKVSQEALTISEPPHNLQEKEKPKPDTTEGGGREVLGPTGRHVQDFYGKEKREQTKEKDRPAQTDHVQKQEKKTQKSPSSHTKKEDNKETTERSKSNNRKKISSQYNLERAMGQEGSWGKKQYRNKKEKNRTVQKVDYPKALSIRLPISIRELAAQMKRKAGEIIASLFMQGVQVKLNDSLDDETTVQLIGNEFHCEITIDSSEEEKIHITEKNVEEEIAATESSQLSTRIPILAFMGHVDHGKTSLIDKIRESSLTKKEFGAITQHIGAFLYKTSNGNIAILDTPGHEAFSSMRQRGAGVADIIILVIAGDEGVREQTKEALQQAREAGCSILVAINKCDKPNFNPENVYRQLAEEELLPEVWGGSTITLNCSAVTGEGVRELLEMVALQSEMLELKANSHTRARGIVIESRVKMGFGNTATILVQNGTLRLGDALVFDLTWGKVRNMFDDRGNKVKEVPPAHPVVITGLADLPDAGSECIAVANEKEARSIAQMRIEKEKKHSLLKRVSPQLETFMQQSSQKKKKVLSVLLKVDVKGSLDVVKTALAKIQSEKVLLNIVHSSTGQISTSDMQLATASQAMIIGFQTSMEKHTENLEKSLSLTIHQHNLIYELVDDVRALMLSLLEKERIEEKKGEAEVLALFKGTKMARVAGCRILQGTIHKNHCVRLLRGKKKEKIWEGTLSSIRREKDIVSEVSHGIECGLILKDCKQEQVGDYVESYDVRYIDPEL